MSEHGERVRQELEKASSLVGTARRLLATGTMVDLAALEGKVRTICCGVVDLGREDGQSLRPDMEALITDLDRLAAAIRDRYDPQAGAPASDPPSDPGREI
ncbi:MAG: hypothetical protein EPN20_02210 [Magnetospirillum sp.]|nr:MAG: hypothetical protein EPN20_02210 [Magnetospirillum sp.]